MNGTISLITAIKDLLAELWRIGNDKLRNVLMAFFGYLLLWFTVVFAFGAMNFKPGVIFFTLFTVIAIAIIIIAEPILSLVALNIEQTRTMRKGLGMILMTQMLIGIYLAIIPVHTSPILFLLLVCVVIAILLMSFTIANKKHFGYRWGMKALIISTFVITAIFLFGGSIKTMDMLKKAPQQASNAIQNVLPKEKAPDAENTISPKDGNVMFIPVKANQTFEIRTNGAFSFWGGGSNYESFSAGVYTRHADHDGELWIRADADNVNIKIYLK